ncbi:MAG: pyridoxal phosphate-dependent aminotransferase [Eubacterium sp.]|nr:pyridoxal phosphate-dependent aminotransferase [Eubacterium sp.]
MYSQAMYEKGASPSKIRDLFEYGNRRKAEIGADKVFDFSIGNPSVPPPAKVGEVIAELLDKEDAVALHGYTSAAGDPSVRQAICDYVNQTHGTSLTKDHFYMTCGAAASLEITLRALCEEGDEFLTFAPFFPEYRVFAESAGADFDTVACDPQDFQPDIEDLKRKLSPRTKGILVNSPNNPSGAVISEAKAEELCAVLKEKSAEYGHPIVLIADEPYRELVYDDVKVPYLMNYYDNTIVCYSYSKSLSLPGERIGYIAVCDRMEQGREVYLAICGAGRSLGYVCAPSLMQRVVARCQGLTSDVSVYKENRDILSEALTKYGFRVVRPDGAFYLFVEAAEPDAEAFAERAKEYELLLVPSDSFGVPGFVRISYCVSTEMIKNSLPAFEKLAKSYGLC